MERKYLIFLVLLFPTIAKAGSCCGQSPSSYSILYSEELISLNSALSFSESLGRVYSDSEKYYVWPDDKERTVKAYDLNIASVLASRHQVFSHLSYQQAEFNNRGENGQAENWGDVLLGYSFELLPEYTYSNYKPIVYISALLNIPTGHSIYDENELSEGADVTGHNQWGAGVGITARKVLFPFTLSLQAKTMRMLSKKFERAEVGEFYDSSVAGFLTYATRWSWTATAGLSWTHLSEKPIRNLGISSESSNVTTTLLSAQWLASDEWGLGAGVSDQSLIGKPKNTIISRSYFINLNYSYF